MKPVNILEGATLVGADQGHAGAQTKGEVRQVVHLHKRLCFGFHFLSADQPTFSFPSVSTRASCLTWPALLCALRDDILSPASTF